MVEVKLENSDLKNIKESEILTGGDYCVENGYIEVSTLLVVIEDLLIEIDRINELMKDIVQDREDNFERIDPMSQSGMCERDFI